MKDGKVKFRKSMGGYNRDDVNGYIESLSSKYYYAESEYRRKIDDLEKKLKELEEKVKKADEFSSTELKGLKEENEKGNLLIGKLNDKIDELSTRNNELEQENASLKSNKEELESIKESCSEAYEKSNMYDKVSEQIGSMIVSANAKAEGIISEAELKARANANAIIDNAVLRLRNMNEKYAGEIMSNSIRLSTEIKKISEYADSFCSETDKNLEQEYKDLISSLESDVAGGNE